MKTWGSAWTDPATVARLAADCNFRPPQVPDAMTPDPLSCATGIDPQACSYEFCNETVGVSCRHQCVRACVDCDLRCRASCASCRASCRGPRCPRACAVGCGQCLQGCLGTQDRCMTAECTAQYRTCALRLAHHFRDGGCVAECASCEVRCLRGDGPCLDACLARGRACTDQEVYLCREHGSHYGWEYLRQNDDPPAGASR
ncbi:MAG: hypothetical protein JWM10_4712 [Myxococcaceae bacterium]|nr:hypothetical protein [Myxococcaceae bacterium]